MIHQEDFFGIGLDGSGDALAVAGPEDQRSQDEQVEGALHQGNTIVVGGPARPPNAPPSVTPAPSGVTGGSEIYRINPDGYPRKVWSHATEIVYALAPLENSADRGRIGVVSFCGASVTRPNISLDPAK